MWVMFKFPVPININSGQEKARFHCGTIKEITVTIHWKGSTHFS